MEFVYDDGGRESAGFKGKTGDCVVRAVAIATRRPYQEIYDALSEGCKTERAPKRGGKHRSARNGVFVRRAWFKRFMESIGWKWTPTMGIGTGCKVHLVSGELPMGRLIVSVSKHYTTVIDGKVHDTHDPQRETIWYESEQPDRVSHRCVYGYWSAAQ